MNVTIQSDKKELVHFNAAELTFRVDIKEVGNLVVEHHMNREALEFVQKYLTTGPVIDALRVECVSGHTLREATQIVRKKIEKKEIPLL